MLNITHYQRNANQNHNEVLLHTSQSLRSKNLQAINAGEGVEKREPSYTVGGNAKQYNHYGEQCGDSLKNCNIWRLNNTLLNNQQNTEEIKKEIKICIETNENENTTTQNLWDTVKAVLRGRFIAIQAYLRKQEKSQINNLTLHLKQLEKEEMKNLRISRRKEILKIRAEINAKETKENIAKINSQKLVL